MVSCVNPFAPAIIESDGNDAVLGDQRFIEGVFQNFRYAYIFKDTLVYGNLLNENFTFVFRDYEIGSDVSWGREEDMRSTYRFFNASQSLDLIWNESITSSGDSLINEISRGFTLTVIFSPTDIVNIQGRANLQLTRETTEQLWKINYWRDESNY